MPNEELIQRQYIKSGAVKGTAFGSFEELNLGATTVDELVNSGIRVLVPASIDYPFQEYKPTKQPKLAKPDRVFLRRVTTILEPVAVMEHKRPSEFRRDRAILKAQEQALHGALALGVRIAIVTDGVTYQYIDVDASATSSSIKHYSERRDLNPGVLENLLAGDAGVIKDPKPLAETVWQTIWHATKAEPKECLLTFVEIFVLKFLSDNLPMTTLPSQFSFYRLIEDPTRFEGPYGKTAIEYYVSTIRPKIKQLFPDNVIVGNTTLPALFGLQSLVSKTRPFPKIEHIG